MNITIDTEFKTLIPPLSEEEFKLLEANCVENGIQDSLKVWNGILVDGHNRFEIAENHRLEYKIEEMEFSSRDDVKLWIIKNQLGRRNLSAYDRSVLALKLKPVLAEKAKEKEAERKTTYQKSEKSELPTVNTTKEVAKVAGVSHDTIHKVEVIENSGDKELIGKVRNKETSINKAYREARGLPPKQMPQTKVIDMNVVTPVDYKPVEEIPVSIDITYESDEEVEDVSKDVTETAALAYVDEIKSGMAKIANTVKYNRADVVKEIVALNCEAFDRAEFKANLDECIKVLVKISNGLSGFC